MARHYHVDLAVFAADADRKWVDNLLSHFDVPGVEVARQGVARRISTHGVYHIVLVRRLTTEMRLSMDTAVGFARRLLITDANHIAFAGGLEIRLDRARFQAQVDARIAEGVESIVPRRRGRPPGRRG